MVFVGALLIIVLGVGGAELVRFQCRRMLTRPVGLEAPRARRAPSLQLSRGTVRPPAHAAPVPASPRTA
jgi:hypothetical protein